MTNAADLVQTLSYNGYHSALPNQLIVSSRQLTAGQLADCCCTNRACESSVQREHVETQTVAWTLVCLPDHESLANRPDAGHRSRQGTANNETQSLDYLVPRAPYCGLVRAKDAARRCWSCGRSSALDRRTETTPPETGWGTRLAAVDDGFASCACALG